MEINSKSDGRQGGVCEASGETCFNDLLLFPSKADLWPRNKVAVFQR